MKKLIALLLAVSTLTMSTVAFADTYTTFDLSAVASGSGASRNYADSSSDAAGNPNWGSPVFRDTSMGLQYLPTYRSGDVLKFALLAKNGDSAVKVNEGDVLTFICSKQSDTDYNNYNVQYIDQIELSPAADTSYIYCTFKLRDSLEDGRYKLEMNLNGITKTYSFLIGTPSVELLYVNDVTGKTPTIADKYLLKDGNAYCFGKATITGGANFSQAGTNFGFEFSNGKSVIMETIRNGKELTPNAQNALTASETHNGKQEIGGTANYFFRVAFEGVTDINLLPDVDVYLND